MTTALCILFFTFGLIAGAHLKSKMWSQNAEQPMMINFMGKFHKVIPLDLAFGYENKIGYFCTQCRSLCEHFDEGICCDCSDKRWESEVIFPEDYPEKWVKVDIYITQHNAWTT